MGVIHKLKPEIIEFLLAQKKAEVKLSCRQLSQLILDKFKIELSKSSVNTVIKNAGLSQPVGRRRKKRKYSRKEKLPAPPLLLAGPEVKPEEKLLEVVGLPVETELLAELESSGAILLKAADYLMGGTPAFVQIIQNRLARQEKNLKPLTEALIYLSLFEKEERVKIWPLIGEQLSEESLTSFLNELQAAKPLNLDIYRVLSTISQEVRCIKVILSDGSTLYLDGQLHTVWSTPHIPYDFTGTLHNIKGEIKKYFQAEAWPILFMAPGYDTPSKEFFDFILSLDRVEKKISRLTLYGNKFEEIETLPLEKDKRCFFVFGLWPWQFVEYRKVKSIAEFNPFRFEPLKQDFYLANVEIALSQPNSSQTLALRGGALKKNLKEKSCLIILSNLPEEKTSRDLANLYLLHWPNLEEAFRDFSRKIELFTYTASSQHFFSMENLPLERSLVKDINGLFDYYLKALDLYVRWHILPAGYENKDFSFTKEQFYRLNCQLKQQADLVLVTFLPPPGYPFLKDLDYACRRVNEKEILFKEKRLWCEVTSPHTKL